MLRRIRKRKGPPGARKTGSTGFGGQLRGQLLHGGRLQIWLILSNRLVWGRLKRVLFSNQPQTRGQRGSLQVPFWSFLYSIRLIYLDFGRYLPKI